jgi:inosine/xanthosine triphosphatase
LIIKGLIENKYALNIHTYLFGSFPTYMKQVIVASLNPIKIAAARAGFTRMFPSEEWGFHGHTMPSGVSAQPMDSAETLLGAKNRAEAAQQAFPEADFWIGLEGGVELVGDSDMEVFAWMYIIGPEGRHSHAKTSTFFLPSKVTALGHADDLVFGRQNSKQGDGAVGLLTHGLIDRANYYEPAVILALIPFANPDLYPLQKTQ